MFPSNSYSNNFEPSNCPAQSNFLQTTQMELYPRLRRTEFYYQRQPGEEYQSRKCEHPIDKLRFEDTSNLSTQSLVMHINPPQNSDMRVYRNSYFS